MISLDVQLAAEPRRKALVVAHERSGTHFLMNTLALCFGYVSDPWVNLDFGLGLNFHDPAAVRRLFAAFAGKPVLEVFKSHHAFGFLAPELGRLRDEFAVFYVYRHPRALMESLLRYQRGVGWDDGPRARSAGELMRSAPRGAMLRYQKEQAPSVLHRWRRHVEEWTEAGPDLGVVPISYEALNRRFEATVGEIAARLGFGPDRVERPPRDRGVVQPASDAAGAPSAGWSAADEAFLLEVAGPTLERLGLPRSG